ncbi:MAG: hypothetical protein AB7T37_06835 [Dehalococcoidia bacterium]
MTKLALLGAVAISALAFIACGDDDDPADKTTGAKPGDVTVALTNWALTPSLTTVAAGTIRFVATHPEEHSGHGSGEAGQIHQLIVAPLAGDESGKGEFGSPVLNLSDIKVGQSKTGEVTLKAGEYELACLVAEKINGKTVNHYEQGMHTKFVVQ